MLRRTIFYRCIINPRNSRRLEVYSTQLTTPFDVTRLVHKTSATNYGNGVYTYLPKPVSVVSVADGGKRSA